MHLLVLSAFRLIIAASGLAFLFSSQCTFWCSVLSDADGSGMWEAWSCMSQCTFWCSVLSDGYINLD